MYSSSESESSNIQVHEFVAHSTNVNCLSFGPKSQQVLATGGEDFKVNIWRVGSAVNVWTLGANKSPIECLCFDSEEQCVVSGAMNGSIKVFDLNEGRLARNVGSHQVNTCSIQYHPYGEFIVSGCVDSTMKVWDVRNKTCIQTYTGHEKEITCVRFSPDGRWVASSSKDGNILLWDLVAGKLMNSIRIAPAYVSTFEFNPFEFIFAAATSARTAKLWDLDSMLPITNTFPDSSPIRAITFTSEGTGMYTATKDSLKVWKWEPSIKLDCTFDVGWDRVVDIRATKNNKVIAGSFNCNFVSVWTVDLDKIRKEQVKGNRGGLTSAPVKNTKDEAPSRVVPRQKSQQSVLQKPSLSQQQQQISPRKDEAKEEERRQARTESRSDISTEPRPGSRSGSRGSGARSEGVPLRAQAKQSSILNRPISPIATSPYGVGAAMVGRDEAKGSPVTVTSRSLAPSAMRSEETSPEPAVSRAPVGSSQAAASTAREISRILSTVPEMRWESESASQDMATSIGESFWKRFKESQQVTEAGTGDGSSRRSGRHCTSPVAAAGVEDLNQLLPPPSVSRFVAAPAVLEDAVAAAASQRSDRKGVNGVRNGDGGDDKSVGYSPSHIAVDRIVRPQLSSRQHKSDRSSDSDDDRVLDGRPRVAVGGVVDSNSMVDKDGGDSVYSVPPSQPRRDRKELISSPNVRNSPRTPGTVAGPSAQDRQRSVKSPSVNSRQSLGSARGDREQLTRPVSGSSGSSSSSSEPRRRMQEAAAVAAAAVAAAIGNSRSKAEPSSQRNGAGMGLAVVGQQHQGAGAGARLHSAGESRMGLDRQGKARAAPDAAADSAVAGRGARAIDGVRGPPRQESDAEEQEVALLAAIDRMLLSSVAVCSSVSQRTANARVLSRMWERNKIDEVVQQLSAIVEESRLDPSQTALVADFLLSVEIKGAGLTLELCVNMLRLLETVFSEPSGYKSEHVVVAVFQTLTCLLEGFGDLIRQTRAMMGVGVDISREDRLRRCNLCYDSLVRLRKQIESIKQHHKKSVKVLQLASGLQPLLVQATT